MARRTIVSRKPEYTAITRPAASPRDSRSSSIGGTCRRTVASSSMLVGPAQLLVQGDPGGDRRDGEVAGATTPRSSPARSVTRRNSASRSSSRISASAAVSPRLHDRCRGVHDLARQACWPACRRPGPVRRSTASVTRPNRPSPRSTTAGDASLRHPPRDLADRGVRVDEQRFALDQFVDAAVARRPSVARQCLLGNHGLDQEPCPAAGRERRPPRAPQECAPPWPRRTRLRADRSTVPVSIARKPNTPPGPRMSARDRPALAATFHRRSTCPATTTNTSSVGSWKRRG